MQINQCRKPVAEAAETPLVTVLAAEEPAAKRTRKKREAAPEPEIITYGEAEVRAANEAVQAAAASVAEQEQPAPVAAEEPTLQPGEYIEPLTLDDLRTRVTPTLASANKLPEAKQWLADHGAPTLKDLDPQQYDAFYKFACELCGMDNL